MMSRAKGLSLPADGRCPRFHVTPAGGRTGLRPLFIAVVLLLCQVSLPAADDAAPSPAPPKAKPFVSSESPEARKARDRKFLESFRQEGERSRRQAQLEKDDPAVAESAARARTAEEDYDKARVPFLRPLEELRAEEKTLTANLLHADAEYQRRLAALQAAEAADRQDVRLRTMIDTHRKEMVATTGRVDFIEWSEVQRSLLQTNQAGTCRQLLGEAEERRMSIRKLSLSAQARTDGLCWASDELRAMHDRERALQESVGRALAAAPAVQALKQKAADERKRHDDLVKSKLHDTMPVKAGGTR